ncbi:MAG: thiamine pyrophosphate-dependent enzyme, partial [Actinomycetia bacterium]|nr:thiamine pyrophosphate-dependent enzyme [Actinomycetes bacterium]
PVVATLMAQGAFPSSDPLFYGMPGMHGTVAAVGALQRSDLLIAIGARFDDRVTGRLDAFAPGAAVIHADIDPAEIGKNRAADLPIVGDAKAVLIELDKALATETMQDLSPWRAFLDSLRRRYPLTLDEDTEDGKLSPQRVIQRLGEIAGPQSVFVTGVGQHQMWSSHFLPHDHPGHWVTSGGLGTMGFCLPALMGAKVGRPDACVWGIDGDGSFQMTQQELTTCSLNDIPVKVAIINNNVLGMIRQHQKLFYGKRYSNSDLFTDSLPDFCKLAEAMGAHAIRVRTPEELDPAIEEAMAINDRPVLVEFQVARDAMVWPMVPAGSSPDNMNIGFGVSPRWEEEAS